MKNAEKKRESNFFEGIVSEEMNELSGTTRVAETNPDEMSTGHLSTDFGYHLIELIERLPAAEPVFEDNIICYLF